MLPLIVQVLTSDKSEEDKFKALELHGLVDPQNREACQGLVKNFHAPQQLYDRIKGLRKKIPRVLPVPSPQEHDEMIKQALATPGTLQDRRAALSKLLEARRPIPHEAEPSTRSAAP